MKNALSDVSRFPRNGALLALAALLLGCGAIRPPPPSADPVGAVVLVRHAERAATPADDPPLTAAGAARADALAATLRDGRITAIITTERLRTRETARPVAARYGLDPEVVRVGGVPLEEHVAAVAAAVARHPAGTVLVVGHSNTIPAIIEALGGPPLTLCDDEYANLFVLLPGPRPARLVRAHYGAPDPESASACRAP